MALDLGNFNPMKPFNPAPPSQYGPPVPTGAGVGGAPLFNNSPDDPGYLTKDLSKDNALPWQKYFDPSVTDTNDPNSMASKALARGQDYYTNTAALGVDDAGHSIAFQSTPLTGGGSNPMSDAISRKYQKDVNSKLTNMQTQREAEAPMQYSKGMSRTAALLGAQQENEMKNFNEQYQFQMNRYNMYNQWRQAQANAQQSYLSSIMGAAGTVAAFA